MGHIGHPADATADKGEHLLAAYAAGLVKLLEVIIAWELGAGRATARRSKSPLP
jgi:creatinine amidohydrolase/Fe(II)-dependent formamide hydrolase-like protein